MKLQKFKAEIFYEPSSLRNNPIVDGYKPLFDKFHPRFKVSGKIELLNGIQELKKGEKANVIIVIPEYEPGEIEIDKFKGFNFYEGENLIGTGLILEKLF